MKLSLKKIKEDLAAFKKYNVVIYGGYVKGFTPRSDIDIAIITRIGSPVENKKIWRWALGKVSEKYDVKIFELLPLQIKASIVNNHKIVYGDRLDTSEYFYHFKSLWEDVEKRYEENQFSSYKEKMKFS